MTIKNKQLTVAVTGFKATGNNMEFTCYGNVKGNVDHALDKTMPGAYMASIIKHQKDGTRPKMLWMHDPRQPPVGLWIEMKEDDHGLFLKGQFADTERGRELYELFKSGALDSFSIGYIVINEKWNSEGFNELHEIHIKEISIVNFACNEESRLVGIKSKLDNDELPTKRELQEILRDAGLSKRQSEKVVNKYDPSVDIFDEIASLYK